MIEDHIQQFRSLIGNYKELHMPTARIQYSYSLSAENTPEIIYTTIYASEKSNDVDFSELEAPETINHPISFRTFLMKKESKEWDSDPTKITMIAFINNITETVQSVLKQWESIKDPLFTFFVFTYGKNVKLNGYKNLQIKVGTPDIKETFNIKDFPSYSILYDSYEITSGLLGECFISSLQNLLNKYSMFEAFYLYSLESPCSIRLFNNSTNKEKEIALSGITVIDFWDNNSQEIFHENLEKNNNINEYKVYVGHNPPGVFCKFSLGPDRLKNPTAEKLKIIDLPTTFIFSNGTVLWKGNRLFTNFNKLLTDLKNGLETDTQPHIIEQQIIEKCKKNYEKEISSLFPHDSDVIIDMKLFFIVDITASKIMDKKCRTKIFGHCKNEEESSKILELFNKLKNSLPNLSYEVSKYHDIFNTTVSQIPENSKNERQDNPIYKEKLAKYKL